ncbi:1-hydroxycarotenoid 3,4-desaturase CrtD [uncultured Litoreibacter sp.]|uniref:1-hydroxycarotenoid 3,4-desaturase CrtD n=1 Tax=uncultured Litoreibacter sp. TaxID=1392394 RepID=UPI0026256A29|nr:1-hydroxycarotenoid 3,4-desaturase CrtD [uncultured Litoreibacter sp.]
MPSSTSHIAIVGAGIGGLAAALRLAHSGAKVSVFEQHSTPGGKMRTVPSAAGPVDAGPTVLTMKPVFDSLFTDIGERLEDHVTLTKEPLLARHYWSDGTTLDLMANQSDSIANVAAAFGKRAASEFERFSARAARLFDAFDVPMMHAGNPSALSLTARVLRHPSLIRDMAPHQTLAGSLATQFREPKLAQLFGRYATYVGGRPDASPAILSLIWHAEAQGVWHVDGGMHRLAQAMEQLAIKLGVTFHYDTPVTALEPDAVLVEGARIAVDQTLFNGDPNALTTGALGEHAKNAVSSDATAPRSLSAYVHAFAAKAVGVDLAPHTVFFGDSSDGEFLPLSEGRMPHDPTLYICSQDRFGGRQPTGDERFEIILNGPPAQHPTTPSEKERQQCQTLVFSRLKAFGLTFTPKPNPGTLTMPAEFAQMFPASNGSLYGRSPHGLMAAFKRPTARTRMKGLYLVGGGAHPGAGVPMATLSAKHAVEAMLHDQTSTSTSPQAATRGGMSTASATTASAPSRSSAS